MNWLVFALIAMCLFSVSSILLKAILTELDIPKLDFSAINQIRNRMNGKTAAFVILSVVLSTVGFYCVLLATQEGKVALVTAVLSLSTVLVACLSAVFLGDSFSLKEILAMSLAIVSILVLVLR
jgi:uncharacterized membrane protein